jgi:hypothetical protein
MKSEIELARAREERSSQLAAEARYARERFDLYKAKAYGPRMTSPARLRELERNSELAEQRLRNFQESPRTAPPQAERGAARPGLPEISDEELNELP